VKGHIWGLIQGLVGRCLGVIDSRVFKSTFSTRELGVEFCQNMEKCCARYGKGRGIPEYCGDLAIQFGCIIALLVV
jgi:hypothetical protein